MGSSKDVHVLKAQIERMLRLNEKDTEVARLFSQDNADLAKGKELGRLFRSPTLFEDIMKTFTLCNCGWSRTISMNAELCHRVGNGAFPTEVEIAKMQPRKLQKRCGVGYRAERMVRLAKAVVKRKLNLEDIE